MNTFKKILITLKTQIGTVVDDFENHEALSAVAIEEIENIGRGCRIQLNRVRNRIAELEKKVEERKLDAKKWSERAVKFEPTDPETALNCVKRMKHAEMQIEALERQHRESVDLEKKVSGNLEQIAERIGEMKARRESLISRQNLARASGTAVWNAGSPARDANAIFERWESRVVGDEFEIPLEEPNDAFAERFEKEEQEADLRATLASLVEQNRKS
jgi:phage shock protein A